MGKCGSGLRVTVFDMSSLRLDRLTIRFVDLHPLKNEGVERKPKKMVGFYKVGAYDRYKWGYGALIDSLLNGFAWGYFPLITGVISPYL